MLDELGSLNTAPSFTEAISEGKLAATVPIREVCSGDLGLATAGLTVEGNEQARMMAFAPDRHTRAVAAIMACSEVRQTIIEDENFELR